MTVAELIEALSRVENKNLEVCTEGCDCYGDAADVIECPDHVEICRELHPDGFRRFKRKS